MEAYGNTHTDSVLKRAGHESQHATAAAAGAGRVSYVQLVISHCFGGMKAGGVGGMGGAHS